jgi:hypothetical protein
VANRLLPLFYSIPEIPLSIPSRLHSVKIHSNFNDELERELEGREGEWGSKVPRKGEKEGMPSKWAIPLLIGSDTSIDPEERMAKDEGEREGYVTCECRKEAGKGEATTGHIPLQ